MDGTRSYLVGERSVAVIDPGPDVQAHVRALVVAAAEADEVRIVLTHGHPDHAAAARPLADRLGAEVFGPEMPGVVDQVLHDGDAVDTDHGALVAVHTPGHTEDHLCFHLRAEGALFAGDLILGQGDTTWVAEYPGCVADYFDSLARLRALNLAVIYPGHGPRLDDPADAIGRFERHRRERVAQVEEALASLSGDDVRDLLDFVYGDKIPPGLEGAAARSLGALVDYVKGVRGR